MDAKERILAGAIGGVVGGAVFFGVRVRGSGPRAPAQGEERGGRGVRRGLGFRDPGLGRGGVQLAAAHRRPFAAVGAAEREGLAARTRSRGVRRRLGARLLDAHQEARVSDPRETPRGTRVTPEETPSDTYRAERSHREMMRQELMDLGVWLGEHPEAAYKN